MGIKRYWNVIITLVLFCASLFLVYILSLDKTEGHRGAGDQLYEQGKYEEALEEYRIALIKEYGSELDLPETAAGEIPEISLDELLDKLDENDLSTPRIFSKINDCWYKMAEDDYERGDRGLLSAETLLTKIDGGEYYEDAQALLAEVQADLEKEMTVDVGRIVIDAYTVDLPEPPEDWDPEEGPWDQYRWVMEDDVREETITKRQYLLYPDQFQVEVIDYYASQKNARAYLDVPSHIAEDSPVDLAILGSEYLEEIETTDEGKMPAGERRMFMFVNVQLTNISPDPVTFTLEDPSMLRLYKTMSTGYDEPITSEFERRKTIPRDFLPDEFTIQPGESTSGWLVYHTYDSPQYFFKAIEMVEDEETGATFSRVLAGKRMPYSSLDED